ncbi:hypothetical protein FHR20_000919 [Sphingomonas leidyi]|uniref:Uncharacterized protein n=1 Tax=Sphingomonas leidyi TaxID=68569 RepID=A0A7X5ZV33_9SPHN|nr:hypothetical protein [Sphingomonas leidyi]NIJ63988.1 hypothetical protein [Sphingomonas leidyi]
MTDTSDDEMGAAKWGAHRVSVRGVRSREMAQLLEDTAKFVRENWPVDDRDDSFEMMYKRTDLGDFVIVDYRA